MEKFKEAYNAGLANGLGNLVSRVMKMAADNGVDAGPRKDEAVAKFEDFNIKSVCDSIWSLIQETDRFIQNEEPFKTIKTDLRKGKEQIGFLAGEVYRIARMLEPIMPATAETIKKLVESKEMPKTPLFVRK
jgi:methionyl-tRNA synthetase